MRASTGRTERVGLALLLAAYLLFALLYHHATPPLEGFDADAHFLAAVYLREYRPLPRLEPELVPISYELIAQPLLYHGLAALAMAPWPAAPARDLARAEVNPYFDKSLSLRQMILLPDAPQGARLPQVMAAAVSTLGGLLAVYGTWRLTRALLPAQWTAALAAGAIVGLNPLFLFLAVTVTNDALAAGMMALTVALAAEAALGRAPLRRWFWAGIWGGLALSAKYSGFVVGLPSLVLLAAYGTRQGWAAAVRAAGLALLGGGLVAGWWMARMFWLYGELIPLRRMVEVIPAIQRAVPLDWPATWEHLPWLVWSYWGVFVAVIAPAEYFAGVRWLMIGGAVGLLPALVWRDRTTYAAKGWAWASLVLWALATAAAVIYWTRTVDYGEQGRLGNIGASAFALLLVIGWQGFVPVRVRPLVHAALALVMVGLAGWQLGTVQRAFGLPPALPDPAPQRSLAARFGEGPVLVGVDLPEGAVVAPGDPMPMTFYWTTPDVIDADQTLFVHLADETNTLLYHFDGVPDQGRHPTRQWRPGATFADPHWVEVPPGVSPGVATLSLGFYPIEAETQRLAVTDAAGQPVGDRLVIGPVYVAAAPYAPAPAPADPVAAWTNGITLADVVVEAADGLPRGLTLTWWSEATLQTDYTLFVQVLDGEDRILAQVDTRGARPSSTWRGGDEVTHAVAWPAEANLTGWQRVILGWYDAAGTRLPLVNGGDFVVIATPTP